MAHVEPEFFRFTSYRKLTKFTAERGDFGFFPSLESCNLNELVIGTDHLGSVQCLKISGLDKVELSFDGKSKNDPLPADDLPLQKLDSGSVVIFVAISCDDEFVVLVLSKNSEYFLSCYVLDGLFLLCTVACGKHFPRCLKFNPVVNNCFAIAFSSGHVQVCQIEKGNIGCLMDKMLEATALCWSPKGKQILIGTSNGLLLQITPQGDIKRRIESPQLPRCWIQEIVWISTFHFICAVSQDPDVAFYSVNLQKDANQPPFVEEIPDVLLSAMSLPESANLRVFMKYLHEWKIIVCASSKSSDIAVIANFSGNDRWVVMMLDENARAQLPIPKDSNEDSLCVGLCLNFCSVRKLQKHRSESTEGQEWPVLLARSQYGYVYAYSIIYEGFPGNQKICLKPKGFQNLSLKSVNIAPNVNSPQTTFTVAVKSQNVPFSSDQKGVHVNKQSDKNQKLSEQVIKGTNNSTTQLLEVKSVPAKSKAETVKATESLLRLFEEDLTVLAGNVGNQLIANNRSLADLQQKTTEIDKFKNELKTQLESLARDVQMLKNAHLHTFNVVNRTKSLHERNHDERYQSRLKSAPLAPDLQKLSESIQANKAFIELRCSEILALIDSLNWKKKKQVSAESEYYENLNAILNNNYLTIMAMGQKIDCLVAKYDGKIDTMSSMRKSLSDKALLNISFFPKMSGLSILDLNRSLKDMDLSGKATEGKTSFREREIGVDLPSDRIIEIKDFLSRRTKVPMNKIPAMVPMNSQSVKSNGLKEQTAVFPCKAESLASSEIVESVSVDSQREARAKMLENLRESVYLSQQPPSDKDAPVVNVKDLNKMHSSNLDQTSRTCNVPMASFPSLRLTPDLKPQMSVSNLFPKADTQKDFVAAKDPPKYAQATDLKQSELSGSSNAILFKAAQKPEGLGFLQKSGNSIFDTVSQGLKSGSAPIVGMPSTGSSLLNIDSNQQNRVGAGPDVTLNLGIDLLLPSNNIVPARSLSSNRPNLPYSQGRNQSAFSTVSSEDQDRTVASNPQPKYDALKQTNAENTLFPNQSSNKGLQFSETQGLNDSAFLPSSSSQQNLVSRAPFFVVSSSIDKNSQPFAVTSANSSAKSESSTFSITSSVLGKPLDSSLPRPNKNDSSVPNVTVQNTDPSIEKNNTSVFGFGPIPKPAMGFPGALTSKDPSSGIGNVGVISTNASKETSTTGNANNNQLGFDDVVKTSTLFEKPASTLFPPPASNNFSALLGQKITVATGLPDEKKAPSSSTQASPPAAPQNLTSSVKSTEIARFTSSQAVTNVTATSLASVRPVEAKTVQKQTPEQSVLNNTVPSESSAELTIANSTASNLTSTNLMPPSQANLSVFPDNSVPISVPSSGGLSLFGHKDDSKSASLFGTTTPSVSAQSVSTPIANITTPQPASMFGQMPTNSSPFGTPQATGSIFGQNTPKSVTTSGWLNISGQQTVASSPFGQMTPISNTAVPKTIFGQTTNSPFGAASTTQNSSLFGQPAQAVSSAVDTGSILGSNSFSGLGGTHSNTSASSNPFGSPFGNSAGMGTGNLGSSPFGHTSSLASTTTQPQISVFGNPNNSPFGQSLQNQGTPSTVFGKHNAETGSVFGGAQAANSPGSIFGQSGTPSAFGTSPASTTIFGKTPAPAFGQAAAFGSGPSFGGGAVFGAGSQSSSVFGKTVGSTGGVFGSQSVTSNMQTFGGLVGGVVNNQAPAFGTGNTQISSPFGAAGSAFGGAMSGTTSAFGSTGNIGNSFSSWR